MAKPMTDAQMERAELIARAEAAAGWDASA